MVLGVWAAVFAGLLAFNIHQGLYASGWSAAATRLVLPLVATGALLSAFWARMATRLVVANALLAVTMALYAGEVGLRWRQATARADAARASGQLLDDRDKLQVLQDLRRQGIDAYPVMRAKNMLLPDAQGQLNPVLSIDGRPLLPMASIPGTTVVSCNETGQWLVYEADRHGFNNPDAVWDVRQPAIGILGDSFAHGSCVPSKDNMAALLRRRFGATVNLGVSGFGPLQELAALSEYLKPLRPPVVLWMFFEGNDLTEDLPMEIHAPLLQQYLADEGLTQNLIGQRAAMADSMRRYLDRDLIAAMNRVDSPYENLVRNLSLDRVRETVGLGPVQIGYNLGSMDEELGLFATVLHKARDRVGGWGGKLYIVYLPESGRYMARFSESAVRRAIHDGVASIAEREQVEMIDLAPVFAQDPAPETLYAYPGAHYSVKGYKVAAEAIARVLEVHDN